MSRKQAPQTIELTAQQAQALKDRLSSSNLPDADKQLLSGLISSVLWLGQQLQQAKLGIRRLKALFGIKTEKKKPNVSDEAGLTDDTQPGHSNLAIAAAHDADNAPETDDLPPPSSTNKLPVSWDAGQNHGCYGYDDYGGCVSEWLAHEQLSVGDYCPECLVSDTKAKLYAVKPGTLIRLVGNAPVTGTRYQRQRLRCPICLTIYKASIPEHLQQPSKYGDSVRSSVAIFRYWLGVPHHRLERAQAMVSIPVPDASQWDLMAQLYPVVKPVYDNLVELSSESDTLYYDDTPNKILLNGNTASEGQRKKGVFTSAVISEVNDYQIYLFFTNERVAGRAIEALVDGRQSTTPLVTMCDASTSNLPKEVEESVLAHWVFCLCIVHGRRRFHELLGSFDKECEFVLNVLAQVYANDNHCKLQGYTDEQRLAYHKQHSTGLMDSLKAWLNNQLLQHHVEPNSTLGQAIRYMLKHWHGMTQFLRHPGAPLDNNLCERAIKVAIRHRRNSLFYRTSKGALVGDVLMSLIHTAAQAGVDAFDYLNQLQRYRAQVAKAPECWLPWHYQATIESLSPPQQALAA